MRGFGARAAIFVVGAFLLAKVLGRMGLHAAGQSIGRLGVTALSVLLAAGIIKLIWNGRSTPRR